jgi:small GTP-binding protein
MASIDQLISSLPPETQELFRFVYDSLPESERASFSLLAGGLPANSTMLRMLVRLSTMQLKMAFGQKKQVAIIGPANVGKSTLYNQLVQNPKDYAAVSPLPGTTRANQSADAGLFAIVDTPGADSVGEVGEAERQQALEAAGQADFLIIMFDAIQGIKQTELELYKQLLNLRKPYIVVLNKIDLSKRDKTGVVNSAAKNLGLQASQVIPIAARDGKNLDQVLLGIALIEPEMVAALGRSLPAYRRRLAWRVVVSGASGSVIVALAPLPFVDLIPLLAIQTVMVLGIARIFNYEITPVRAREILATFGLGFLGRRLFYELTKLGGLPGWLLGSAISASMTVTMGYAAILWFERGEQLSKETLAHITRQMTGRLVAALKDIGSKKPQAATLSNRIAQILENVGLEEITLIDKTDQAAPTITNTQEGE